MPGEAAARQWACQQLLVRFFDALDAKRYEEVPELFAAQAPWRRPGAVATGPAEILAALCQRPANRQTRHIVSNFLVTREEGGKVHATAMLATFAVEDADTKAAPSAAQALVGFFRANAVFTAGPDEPRFEELSLAPDLLFAR